MPVTTEQLEEAIRTKIDGGVEHVVSYSAVNCSAILLMPGSISSSKSLTFLVSDLCNLISHLHTHREHRRDETGIADDEHASPIPLQADVDR